MAKLRPAKCYGKLERPFTRISKYKSKSFVRGVPGSRIVKFHMGNPNGNYSYKLVLNAIDGKQVRHNALESSRLAANRYLSTNSGNDNFHLLINVYPHQVLRENPIACGAGADRYSTGMQKAFGKSIGRAARIKPGQTMLTVETSEKHVNTAKEALRRAGNKLPVKCHVEVIKKEL